MENGIHVPIAIVGVGAVLPDAPNVATFWDNIKSGRYSISEVSPDRWDPALYYDTDPAVPDKAYSKIGGWVRDFAWDPLKWHLPIPPRVANAMDDTQKWAIACTREALEDFGYPGRPLDLDRTAVILGNAMGGERHYLTVLRLNFPEYARELAGSAGFAALPEKVRQQITGELHDRIGKRLPNVTEDTMPGELANCIAGRIANLFNFHGPNFVVDAACASAMAAITAAAEGLIDNQFDFAVTGGIDRNMGASTFIKFCKIGALSATGTRPYAEGADGFVMGEGAALFLLRRLADAERDGDHIYAVLRGVAGSSDGKGKGITAPNPIGQKLCTERAWKNAGLPLSTATMIEGHGTSTKVGDVVEVQSLTDVLNGCHLPQHSVALGSVKSNVGHLKGAAGAAGILKTVLALRDKVLPPSVHCDRLNPDIDFAHSPLYVNTELKAWTVSNDTVRRAGVSAFGFGGTNFHAVFEEYIPGMLKGGNGKHSVAVSTPTAITMVDTIARAEVSSPPSTLDASFKVPLRGALVVGAATEAELAERLRAIQKAAAAGQAPVPAVPVESDLRAPERLAIDFADASDLATKATATLKGLAANQPAVWKALRAQGIFHGHGLAPKVAFLYTGQGSQYVNMLRSLRETEPIVAETFSQADRIMAPLLPKALSEFIFVDPSSPAAIEQAEEDLRQTAITQPAVLATDLALTKLFAAYGIQPDMTMGHSLGEYGALVASGVLSFDDALEAVSARGREMTRVSMEDNGRMAAVFAPLTEIERVMKGVSGYVVIANINSKSQAVIGGASIAVTEAIEAFIKAGFNAVPLPVSHAFHTSIVAPASEPLKHMLRRCHLESPKIPVVANVTGEFYPEGPGVSRRILELLSRQVASPVKFVQGLQTLYQAGARIFVEVGPKKALQGFADDVLGSDAAVVSLFSNHPKFSDVAAFNQALCGLYAAGLGRGCAKPTVESARPVTETTAPSRTAADVISPLTNSGALLSTSNENHLPHQTGGTSQNRERSKNMEPVVITGAALGLPGTDHIFDDGNLARILRGEQFIDVIPTRFRQGMLDKNITRLVKSDNGGPTFESINNVADVIKLAGRGKDFDLEKEYGISAERVAAFDRTTKLAIAAGIDALRDAGIPLVMRYKSTTKGTQLPDRWGLADELRDDTGVIFASAFPGYDSFADEMSRYYGDHARREQLAMMESVRDRVAAGNGHSVLTHEIQRRIDDLRLACEQSPYVLDRKFLLRTLAMGHSQFAEFIGARGPNTQINSACASTAFAMAMAEDWIRAGRCRRVIIVSADDVTSDHLVDWFGAAFLASGAAATDEIVSEAATPFDRRRHGMIMGMGAAAMVVESPEAARERGIQPICEVLSTVTANSAFHATRLSLDHIQQVMEKLMTQAESKHGIDRHEVASRMMFVSHETYTPARGGSASAEINALRKVFGDTADQIVIANTKGFTGHAMATGIEDVVAIKGLETGCVPPVPNFKEVDPELGNLNLSRGGYYPIEYALRLGAGFGSQISMVLLRWIKTKDEVRLNPNALGYAYRIVDKAAWDKWLSRIAGTAGANLEVVHHTLRIRDERAAARVANLKQAETISQMPKSPEVLPEVPPIKAKVPVTVADPEVTPKAPAEVLVMTPSLKTDTVEGSVKARILSLVADKTGYPEDMLDLDLDLEADLGVDTVKQAEVFAAVREIYQIPRDTDLKLRDFPTLAHVIRFVYDRRPDLEATKQVKAPVVAPPEQVAKTEQVSSTAVVPSTTQPPVDDGVKQRILALVVEKTGYPEDMLDLDLDLEADLGVDTVKQAEMFAAIRQIYNIPRDADLKLRDFPTLAHVIQFVYGRRPDLARKPQETPAAANVAEVPTLQGVAAPLVTTDDSIKDQILEIVTEKTGYPKDMLDLDLDLEADLGIDTVKQAEMFAAVRAAYNIPRKEDLKLRDFPTLAHVIKFARDAQSSFALPPKKPVVAADSVRATAIVPPPPCTSFEAANTVPRRVPVPILRPPMSICKATGVKLTAGSRVVLMLDKGGVGEALAGRLASMGVEALRLDSAITNNALTKQIETWLSAGPIHGVYWLPALDDEGAINAMDAPAWQEAQRIRVKLLYTTMRLLYTQISSSDTFLISSTRMGGQHGYDAAGASAPLGGAVAGFTKTYKRERPDAMVKAIDFSSQPEPPEVAQALIDETLRDPGAVEIGYENGLRWTVGLEEQPVVSVRPGLGLNKNTVFVVTGAAGSIVSAITADLAAASGGTFYLFDVVPEPDGSNPDIQRFVNDKEGLKRELFTRMQARGERATPALVEKELAGLERAHAALSAIQAVQDCGGKARYFSVDLTDNVAVHKVIEVVRNDSGRIDVLLHAAGMERSHFLPDKDLREFELVFGVKADGWFNLLRAIGDMPLGATVAFSSIAGRFGNAGQADYSAANDLLCKITSSFRTTRPDTRAIAIDWTAWGGIGMATRGSIPKMMELAGIDVLPPEAGIPIIRRELTASNSPGEIVIGQRLGALLNEWDDSGGVDKTLTQSLPLSGPMVGKIANAGIHSGFTIETTLDPKVQPFLNDHRIDGTPVLPGVMGMEVFAEAALSMAPGFGVECVEDVNFLAPFKFYRDEPRTLTVHAISHPSNDGVVTECRLLGSRTLPGQPAPQLTTHFTGRVRLTTKLRLPILAFAPRLNGDTWIESSDIYQVYFHGPAYQVLARACRQGKSMMGELAKTLPSNHYPVERPLIIEPRLIELCFQTVGLLEMDLLGHYGLPLHVDRVEIWKSLSTNKQETLYAVATPNGDATSFDVKVVDRTGEVYVQLTGYCTVALPGSVNREWLTKLHAVAV